MSENLFADEGMAEGVLSMYKKAEGKGKGKDSRC